MDAPDTPKQIVRVTIFNQTYAVSAPDDAASTEELARLVDELMSSIARLAGNLDATRTAVLACLHLADKLRAAELELALLRDTINQRSRSLTSALDRALVNT